MRRREFITVLGSIAMWPLASRAQQAQKSPLVGVLKPFEKGYEEGERPSGGQAEIVRPQPN